MIFTIFQDSAIGARRSNQDRMGYCYTSDSLLMVVADGLGGHWRGEVAAQLTVQSVAADFQRLARPRLDDPAQFVEDALLRAHREILRFQESNALAEAPRTTVVLAIIQDDQAWWAHAGDTRLYWIRGGAVLNRTRDHSRVQHLVSRGLLRPEDQDSHPDRNKVLNCLGSPTPPGIERALQARLMTGDTLLLCTDGLWSALPERLVALRLHRAPLALEVPTLVRDAIAAAGRLADNTTALALRWGVSENAALVSMTAPELPRGILTTSIRVSGDADADGLSDEDIERSIREIREAIERSSRSDPSGREPT